LAEGKKPRHLRLHSPQIHTDFYQRNSYKMPDKRQGEVSLLPERLPAKSVHKVIELRKLNRI